VKKIREGFVDNLIIGFGMSAIPIIRELELSGQSYKIISKNNNIWREMESSGKLNFDLVSTKFSTYFSWDLVDCKKDDFPTAKEFFNYQKKYYEKYKNKIIKDNVSKIANYKTHSIVETQAGEIYKAKNLIIASGLKRKISESIINFDRKAENKTIVINSSGDTANMLIADLICNNNKIYILTNGGPICLSKSFSSPCGEIFGKKYGGNYTLDQFEFHNLAFLSKGIYKDLIGGCAFPPLFSSKFPTKLLKSFFMDKNLSFFSKLWGAAEAIIHNIYKILSFFLARNLLHSKFSISRDMVVAQETTMPFISGHIFLKHWPIDVYYGNFAGNLINSIKQGYKLNDLPFFINEGLVEILKKQDFKIDKNQKQLTSKTGTIKYDYLIEGSPERPNLDDIKIIKEDQNQYKYVYRDSYLGILPNGLHNTYVIGTARPNTGGIGNITEMQSLFIHKMISNKQFRDHILENIENKKAKYAKKYFPGNQPLPLDHLVYYGFYNEEIARDIGISFNYRWKDLFASLLSTFCKFNSLTFFLFPNNCFMYRLSGDYKVPFASRIIKNFMSIYNFTDLGNFILTYFLYRFIYLCITVQCVLSGLISWQVAGVLVLLQFLLPRLFLLFFEKGYVIKFITSSLWAASCLFLPVSVNLGLIVLDLLSIPLLRKFGHDSAFSDLSSKHKYKKFFYKDYIPALKSLLHKD